MHEQERWAIILDIVARNGLVLAGDLPSLTGASAPTIRRDLTRLAASGRVRRVHGGAAAIAEPVAPAVAVAGTLLARRKRAIARHAAALATDGMSIILNGGTTVHGMTEFLAPEGLEVFTNSFAIASTLIGTTRNRVMLPAGEIYRDQAIILSPFDEDTTRHASAARMFMSAMSVGPLGLIEGDPLIARAEAKLLDRASELVVLADSSKFLPRGSMAVAPLSRIGLLITDDGAPPAALSMLREAGVAIEVVATPG